MASESKKIESILPRNDNSPDKDWERQQYEDIERRLVPDNSSLAVSPQYSGRAAVAAILSAMDEGVSVDTVVSNINTESEKGKVDLLNALMFAEPKANLASELQIDLVSYVVDMGASFTGSDGTVNRPPRTTLIDADGKSYSFFSRCVFSGLVKILSVYGYGALPPNFRIGISPGFSRDRRNIYNMRVIA